MKTTYAFIPARAGSKGVKDKNIRILGTTTLLEWSIKAADKTPSIDKIIVSTDSQHYAHLAKEYGAEIPCLRPVEIASDISTDYDFVAHMLSVLNAKGEFPDFVVHLRPTTPFRDPKVIDRAIQTFKSLNHYTSLRSVHEMAESAYKTFEKTKSNQLVSSFSRREKLDHANNARQTFPKTYIANGYVDIISTRQVHETGTLHGNQVFAFETEVTNEVDIERDFEFLEFTLHKHQEYQTRLFDV